MTDSRTFQRRDTQPNLEVDMTFKELYAHIADHLQRAIDKKKTTFTHRSFKNYEFEITAKRTDKKD